MKPTEDAIELVADAINAARYDTPIWRAYNHGPLPRLADADQSGQEYARRLAKAAVRALEAASSPAPGEPVAFKPGDGCEMRRTCMDGKYCFGHCKTAFTTPPEPVQGVLDGVLACLRHTHDRLSEYPEFETLQLTINAEVRNIKAAIANAERSPLPEESKDV